MRDWSWYARFFWPSPISPIANVSSFVSLVFSASLSDCNCSHVFFFCNVWWSRAHSYWTSYSPCWNFWALINFSWYSRVGFYRGMKRVLRGNGQKKWRTWNNQFLSCKMRNFLHIARNNPKLMKPPSSYSLKFDMVWLCIFFLFFFLIVPSF